MKKLTRRFLALLLALALCIGVIPAMADEQQELPDAPLFDEADIAFDEVPASIDDEAFSDDQMQEDIPVIFDEEEFSEEPEIISEPEIPEITEDEVIDEMDIPEESDTTETEEDIIEIVEEDVTEEEIAGLYSTVYSGTCGDNLTWTLDDNGLLIISGSGDMSSYYQATVPWEVHRSDIRSIIIENGVTSIGDTAFSNCPNLTEVTIPNSITRIGDSAFDQCYSLTVVTIPNSVTSIGSYAFSGCSSLTEINIPYSVFEIGREAFSACFNLAAVTIQIGVTSIGPRAFDLCEKLTEIYIPATVVSIGESVFADCDLLTSIVVDGGNPIYDSRNGCNAIIEKATNTLIAGCSATTEIPAGVTGIGNGAFEGNSNLTNITIPISVTSIGSYAFFYTGLRDVYYGGTEEDKDKIEVGIENGGLLNASVVTWHYVCNHTYTQVITREAACTEAGVITYTCSECGDTYTEPIPATGHTLVSVDPTAPTLTATGNIACFQCSSCHRYFSDEEGTTEISLEEIVIPKLLDIGTADVAGIADVEYSGNPVNFDIRVFHIDSELTEGTDYEVSVEDLTDVGTGTVTITGIGLYGGSASYYFTIFPKEIVPEASLSEASFLYDGTVKEPDVTVMDETVLLEQGEDYNVTYEDGRTDPGTYKVTITLKGNYSGSAELSFTIEKNPDIIIVVDSGTYGDSINWTLESDDTLTISGTGSMDVGPREKPWDQYNGQVSRVVIAEGITDIPDGFFSESSLTEIRIPDSVTEIGNEAFRNCVQLTVVTIPESVEHIGENAFSGCSGLTEVFYSGTQEEWKALKDANSPDGNEPLFQAAVHCSDGDYREQTECTHTYTQEITQEPTCTEPGIRTFICSRCQDSYTESIPTTEHSYDTGKVTKADSCTEAGVMTFTCTICGNTYIESINPTGHKEVTDPEVAATCTEAGKTAGSHCSRCQEVIIAQQQIPALGHAYQSKITKEAACAEAGVRTFICSRCQDSYTESIPATGHSYENGYCRNCGDILDGFAEVDHRWGYYRDGKLQDTLSGLQEGTINGTKDLYYIEKGLYKTTSGIARKADGSDQKWYYVENGVYKAATGIAKRADGSDNKFYFVKNGVYTKATGIAQKADGSSAVWYYVKKGVYTKATGITRKADGSDNKTWYYVAKGKHKKSTGLYQKADGTKKTTWYYVQKGVWKKSTGLVNTTKAGKKSTYYISKGVFKASTGLVKAKVSGKSGWYYIKKGIYTKKTLIAKKVGSSKTKYYVKKGKLTTYTGKVKIGKKTYNVVKGVVK